MIEYIFAENIDDRVLKRAAITLRNGGLVAHPTDTSWHVSCAISSKKGIKALKALKDGMKGYTLTMIASQISQAGEVSDINTPQYKVIHRLTPGPYVFILGALRKLEKTTGLKRKEVGFRIPDHPVPIALVETLGEPLFSVTASRSMDNLSWWDPEFAEENLFEMGWELEVLEGVSTILDTGESLSKVLTTVIDLKDGEMNLIREGIGPIDL